MHATLEKQEVKPIAAEQFRRYSIEEYDELIKNGTIQEDDRVELLEGWIVRQMSRNPPHDSIIAQILRALIRRLDDSWEVRPQCGASLIDSRPEPDVVVARKSDDQYLTHHPGPEEIALVIEVSETSLALDRRDKARIYAKAGIPEYWIVNVRDSIIEVYSEPKGKRYLKRRDYEAGDSVPLPSILAGSAKIPVDEILRKKK